MSERPATQESVTGSAQDADASGSHAIDRTSSFRVTYIAVFLFILLYLFTVEVFEQYLQLHFEQVVSHAIDVDVSTRHPGQDIRLNLILGIGMSDWTDIWGVKVDVQVLARDDNTWLYVNGRTQIPAYADRSPVAKIVLHRTLLPATAAVDVNVAHNTTLSNTILIAWATILFVTLFFYNRRVIDRENTLLDEARVSRDRAAARTRDIEHEIETVRAQLRQVEPANLEDREEIVRLQSEQQQLQAKLDALAHRERALRSAADRAAALEEEGHVLEQLLEEASVDLTSKSTEISELEKSLRKASKISGSTRGKPKEGENLAKRMETLYPRLDIDARAIDDIVTLGDEATKLRAEECLKRLNEEADNRGVRRKVGGLPNHLSVYELGFAGKRRIYYAKVDKGRVRILVVGAKNTQQSDLDYISRLPKSEFIAGLPTTSRRS